jgi:hypothetical protein
VRFAEHERSYELAIRRLPVDRPVELGTGRRGQPALRLDDGVEHGRRAGLIDEHAGREVDLAGPRIGAKRIGEAEDRVGRRGGPGEGGERHG